jgi:predicted anti-sigma-YlaC factor YlaD
LVPTSSDSQKVQCSRSQDLLSARLDGECTTDELSQLDGHLRSCAGCRSRADALDRLHRVVRLRAAEPVPDLSASILSRVPAARRHDGARWALLAVASTQLLLALPAMVAGPVDEGVHVTRHVGALSAAVAVGLLYAASRPSRAAALLPVVAAFVGFTLAVAVADLARGEVTAVAEVQHLLDISSLVLLWLVAGRPCPRTGAHRPPRLTG